MFYRQLNLLKSWKYFTFLQVLEELISPGLQLEDIPLFFWQHLQRDLEILATSLGRSIDEAALTVHLVLKQICTHYTGKV